jgi:hypothetical protein
VTLTNEIQSYSRGEITFDELKDYVRNFKWAPPRETRYEGEEYVGDVYPAPGTFEEIMRCRKLLTMDELHQLNDVATGGAE